MSTDSADDERMHWSPWAIAAAILLLLIFGVIAFGTVRGCFFVDPQEAAKLEEDKKKKEDEEKKQDIDISSPIVLPSEPKTPIPLIKPGHWETISQNMRMNYRDFVGDSRGSIVDAQNRPYAVAKTPFNVQASRPVLLTKGRAKSIETTLFLPEAPEKTVFLSTELEERGPGFGLPKMRTPLTPMPSYQYHFVVLAKEPSRYAYIKTIDAVKAPYGGESADDEEQGSLLYSVVTLAAGDTVALPDNPLTWTSTAYLLWDEVDPGDPISPEQKKAIVDWIHWGGQLIISGPDSLDLLKGSFLEPYLPATSGGPIKIDAKDPAIAELNKHWMISTEKTPGEPLKPVVPWSGVKLIPIQSDDVKLLPNTGGLFVERQVGRGRVVVSAVQLSERDFINWRSGFQSFFNGCLMRRRARKYTPGQWDVSLTWAANSLRERRLDAALNTRLRYFTRDLGVETAYHYEDVPLDAAFQYNANGQQQTMRQYRPPTNPGGIGAWSDFSATANAARSALREAAGVEVPGADFVVLCLAAYLVALVPINWIIFRTIGRVEWAWIAAPIIALIGTWTIVQRAQLDIGFVRAQTEIAILEQQPDHPRAHLSRYTALYTSLSTTYDFKSDNPTTLAAPFPSRDEFQMLIGQGLTPVNFQRYDDVRLVGLPISSNTTGFVHSEQMHALDGAIREGTSTALGTPQIENHSKMELHSVCVVRKPTHAEATAEDKSKRRTFEGRWIGDLLPGQSAATAKRMSDLQSPDKKPFFAEERAKEAGQIRTPRLNLEPMFQLALDPQFMEEGETRLVARVDEVLPGEAITPEASQVRGATLVVVHLKYAAPPPPEKDQNTRRDIKATDDLPGTEPIEL
jgi:hypothetical protein